MVTMALCRGPLLRVLYPDPLKDPQNGAPLKSGSTTTLKKPRGLFRGSTLDTSWGLGRYPSNTLWPFFRVLRLRVPQQCPFSLSVLGSLITVEHEEKGVPFIIKALLGNLAWGSKRFRV